MLLLKDLLNYDFTSPKEKPTSKEALTLTAGQDLSQVSDYVYQTDTGVGIWCPTTGATTSSVHRTRSEFKGKPYYLTDQPLHEFEVTFNVSQVNWFGSFVCMQMHCQDGNDPTNKTFFTKSDSGVYQLMNGMRIENTSKEPQKKLLLDNVQLNQDFTIKYTISKTGLFHIDAYQGDNKGSLEDQLSEGRAKRQHVPHFGSYQQIDEGNSKEPKGDGSRLILILLKEYHGDVPVVITPPVEPPQPTRTIQNLTADVNTQLYLWQQGLTTDVDTLAKIQTLKTEADNDFTISDERKALYTHITQTRLFIRSGVDFYVRLQQRVDELKQGYLTALQALQSDYSGKVDTLVAGVNQLPVESRKAPILNDLQSFKNSLTGA